MGITSVLPNTPGPRSLAIAAMVVLALVLVARIVARMRAEAVCRKDYRLGMLITALVLTIGFALVAYTGIMESLAIGEMISLLGGAIIVVLICMATVGMLRGGGRIFFGRIPLALITLVALALYVAILGYTQTVFANAGGSVSGSAWWTMYRTALVVADVLTIIAVPYAVVALVVVGSGALVRTLRRRSAGRTHP